VVALVLRNGQPAFEHVTGMADREAGRPMTAGTLFRIASQSKAIATVAAMTLVEDGTIGLHDPISRWLPGFATATVSEAHDSAGVMVRRVVPVRRAITVRDLMTHTAGMSYGTESWLAPAYEARGLGPAAGYGWYFADKTVDICTAIEPLGELPLAAQPGEGWVYGYATDVLGCLVERASGVPFDEFVQRHVTGPLGMTDTRFCVPGADADRLAVVYSLDPDGLHRAAESAHGQGHYLAGPCRAYSGGAGLVSTAADYAAFLEVLRRGGELGGARVLSSASVTLMTSDHVGELYRDAARGFGLGFEILLDPGGAARYGSPGAYGWGGAYLTSYWVDPAEDLVAVLMVQLLARGSTLQDRFRTLVYAMLEAED
jgi:CubicO group peptidase (beta-lactamase class C family)